MISRTAKGVTQRNPILTNHQKKKKIIKISFRTSFLKTMAGASKKDMFRRSNTHIIEFLNSDKASSPRFLHIDTILE